MHESTDNVVQRQASNLKQFTLSRWLLYKSGIATNQNLRMGINYLVDIIVISILRKINDKHLQHAIRKRGFLIFTLSCLRFCRGSS
ncbi:hypothetical protein RchiOBHm_Chr1g0326541 [Rosa chinensis]|uniref:Uncharacterized protein n=1 Tax=Rosa chinensis TaxID=74649 RepID=A0A2P6SAB8_ROSCH|nr:hypothetical protein RchiOBHm_Chr1g0326541 [Rosa chinensis]